MNPSEKILLYRPDSTVTTELFVIINLRLSASAVVIHYEEALLSIVCTFMHPSAKAQLSPLITVTQTPGKHTQ